MIFKFVLAGWATENWTRYLKLLGLITGTNTIASMGRFNAVGNGNAGQLHKFNSFTKLHDVYWDPHRITLELQSKDPPTGDQAVNPPTGHS